MLKRIIPSSLFLLLLIFLFNPVKVWGQQVPQSPDCGPIFINQAVTTGTTIPIPSATGKDNRTLGCQSWVLAYQANATSGTFTSIDFQSANGAVTPGTFNSWPGTVVTGINPNTNQSTGVATFSTGCVSMAECSVDNSWVRVLITRNNFVGTITGVLYGYKTGPIFNVIATVVPAGTQNVNLVQVGSNTVVTGGVNGSQGVGGVAAAGASASLGNPVQTAGIDGGGVIRRVITDTSGRQVAVGAAADSADNVGNPVLVAGHDNDSPTPNVRTFQLDTFGQMLPSSSAVAQADGSSNTPNIPTFGVSGAAAPTTFRIFPFVFNGSTWDRQFACTNQAVITLSAATDAVIIAGVAATNIRICHISWTTGATTADVTIRQGTGSTCGTNTATIAGPYYGLSSKDLDFGAISALRTTVQARDVCIHTAPAVTMGGVVIYAQF